VDAKRGPGSSAERRSSNPRSMFFVEIGATDPS
jgi:hypothetical protein